MKRQVPRRIPGILPLVRHGDDVAVEHVEPLRVTCGSVTRPKKRMRPMLIQPAIEVEIVILLGPQHACERLAMHTRSSSLSDLGVMRS